MNALKSLACKAVPIPHYTYNIHMNSLTPPSARNKAVSLFVLTIPVFVTIYNPLVSQTPGEQTTPFYCRNTIIYILVIVNQWKGSCLCILSSNQVSRKSFPPQPAFLCNTWTRWTSSEFIGPEDHPHHFHLSISLPPVVPSPTWCLCGFFSPLHPLLITISCIDMLENSIGMITWSLWLVLCQWSGSKCSALSWSLVWKI